VIADLPRQRQSGYGDREMLSGLQLGDFKNLEVFGGNRRPAFQAKWASGRPAELDMCAIPAGAAPVPRSTHLYDPEPATGRPVRACRFGTTPLHIPATPLSWAGVEIHRGTRPVGGNQRLTPAAFMNPSSASEMRFADIGRYLAALRLRQKPRRPGRDVQQHPA